MLWQIIAGRSALAMGAAVRGSHAVWAEHGQSSGHSCSLVRASSDSGVSR
jgi:hypothetical protein